MHFAKLLFVVIAMVMFSSVQGGDSWSEVCKMKPETGDCRALFQRFYFDVEANGCKRFNYGGCGGNKNNFKTIEDCNKYCGNAFL